MKHDTAEAREPELIPLWPDAGQMANLRRNATYAAAASGQIPTVRIGKLLRVPLRRWRQMLDAGETSKIQTAG